MTVNENFVHVNGVVRAKTFKFSISNNLFSRAYYYDAVDSYDVQIIESRFGYFMCEMQEELIMGNMILSGQVVPD